jgi:short-subunit dehydrogenase
LEALVTIKKTALIIGGTSGLGYELALRLRGTHAVYCTGRRTRRTKDITFKFLNLGSPMNTHVLIRDLLFALPPIDLLVYAAGFYQEGRIDSVSDSDINRMIAVGLQAPVILLQGLMQRQKKLEGFIAITSTSQWTPRKLEPVYAATKAGLAHFANSISLDERVGKVMVAGPTGMHTEFWDDVGRSDLDQLLQPSLVAKTILAEYGEAFSYQCIRILRDPFRVDVVDRS